MWKRRGIGLFGLLMVAAASALVALPLGPALCLGLFGGGGGWCNVFGFVVCV